MKLNARLLRVLHKISYIQCINFWESFTKCLGRCLEQEALKGHRLVLECLELSCYCGYITLRTHISVSSVPFLVGDVLSNLLII